MDRFLSRKLLMALASVASILLGDYSINGTVHQETLMATAGIVIAYLAAQGWVDGKEKKEKKDE